MYRDQGLTIRTIEDSDLEAMRALRNDPSTWMQLTDVSFLDAEGQRAWFQRIRTAGDRKYYVVCDDEHPFIGIVRTDEIDQRNRSIRIGADIAPALRGKGYASRLYALLKRFCFDVLNMHRVWLAVLDTNTVARALYEKQGFVEEGRYRSAIFRDGAWHDYVIMSVLEEEYRGNGER
jgi:RimJ/RimL family protein N-acetyltransferase